MKYENVAEMMDLFEMEEVELLNIMIVGLAALRSGDIDEDSIDSRIRYIGKVVKKLGAEV